MIENTETTMAWAAISCVTGILSNGGKNKVLGAISVGSLIGMFVHEPIENMIKEAMKKN